MSTATTIPQPRMKNPGMVIPEATNAIKALVGATMQGDVPQATLGVVPPSQPGQRVQLLRQLRFQARQAGRRNRRAALRSGGLARIAVLHRRRARGPRPASRSRASATVQILCRVIWDEAARHYNERQLAVLVLWIATTNVFNRINVATRQPAGVGGD